MLKTAFIQPATEQSQPSVRSNKSGFRQTGRFVSIGQPLITEARPSDIMEEGKSHSSAQVTSINRPRFIKAPMIPRSLNGGAGISKLNKLEGKDQDEVADVTDDSFSSDMKSSATVSPSKVPVVEPIPRTSTIVHASESRQKPLKKNYGSEMQVTGHFAPK